MGMGVRFFEWEFMKLWPIYYLNRNRNRFGINIKNTQIPLQISFPFSFDQ